jgi:uncharacterized membrane protein (Fun14 family)
MEFPSFFGLDGLTLTLLGISLLIGFILGSAIKTALKIITVLIFVVVMVGLFKPDAITNFISLIVAIKPLLSEFQNTFLGPNATPTFIAFGLGFSLGLLKG